jgi:hypothetical protein
VTVSGWTSLALMLELGCAFAVVLVGALVGGADWLRHYAARPDRRFRRGERVIHPPDAIGTPEVRGVPE